MQLKVLVDNNTYVDQYYCGEPAVSYYIQDEDKHLLLDVGYSNLFLKNAKKLNIDISKINTIVISHGHDDHTRGLKYYFEQNLDNNISIVAHPDAFKEKIYESLKICSPILENQLKKMCNLTLTKEPKKISENLTFLGEIPSLNNFEKREIIGQQKSTKSTFEDDYVFDDSALVYKGEKGIFIITGCSHSGICNIIEYAKKITNEENIIGVIGGFHLNKVDEKVIKTIDYFKENNIKKLYPSHCTSFSVKAEIHKTIPIKEVGVGLEIEVL